MSTFVRSGWLPGVDKLECNGFHCDCRLVPTDDKARGTLPRGKALAWAPDGALVDGTSGGEQLSFEDDPIWGIIKEEEGKGNIELTQEGIQRAVEYIRIWGP
jgi:hypothetical protein